MSPFTYSEDDIHQQLAYKKNFNWRGLVPLLIMCLAGLELFVIVLGLAPTLTFCYEKYNNAIGIYKTIWFLAPTFAFLNGMFLASFTCYKALQAYKKAGR